jgi:Restriction endonuclease BglII
MAAKTTIEAAIAGYSSTLDSFLEERGWKEKKFSTKIRVDAEERDSPTHKVDCFKGRVGLEIEWNNKDPFFDRDLNNFRLLFDLRVIDAGVIITRASPLQQIFKSLGKKVADKYGASTTHMDKLLPRMEGGGGGGCLVHGTRMAHDDGVCSSGVV